MEIAVEAKFGPLCVFALLPACAAHGQLCCACFVLCRRATVDLAIFHTVGSQMWKQHAICPDVPRHVSQSV